MKEEKKEIFSTLQTCVPFTVDPLRMFSIDLFLYSRSYDGSVASQLKILFKYVRLVINIINTVISGSTLRLHAVLGLT